MKTILIAGLLFLLYRILRFYNKNKSVKILNNSLTAIEGDGDLFKIHHHFTYRNLGGWTDPEKINALKKYQFSISLKNATFTGHYFCESKLNNSDLKQFVVLIEAATFGRIIDKKEAFDVIKSYSSGNYATAYYEIRTN